MGTIIKLLVRRRVYQLKEDTPPREWVEYRKHLLREQNRVWKLWQEALGRR